MKWHVVAGAVLGLAWANRDIGHAVDAGGDCLHVLVDVAGV